MPYKKLAWGAHCTCWARAHYLHLCLFSQGYRPNQWTDTTQTLWSNSHHGWAGAIVVNGDEWHMRHVPEGKNCLNMGSSEFVNFLASDTKLGTLAQLNKGTTTLYNKLTWRAHCTCWAHAQNWHLFKSFKAAGQSNERTRLKLRELTAPCSG